MTIIWLLGTLVRQLLSLLPLWHAVVKVILIASLVYWRSEQVTVVDVKGRYGVDSSTRSMLASLAGIPIVDRAIAMLLHAFMLLKHAPLTMFVFWRSGVAFCCATFALAFARTYVLLPLLLVLAVVNYLDARTYEVSVPCTTHW